MIFFYSFFLYIVLYIIFIPSAFGVPCSKAFEEKKFLTDGLLYEKIREAKIQEEKALKLKGYNSFWTKGLDEVQEWLIIKKQFIALEVNPHTTHIDYFANKIPQHIEHIRSGLKFQHKSIVNKQRKALKHLEKKAKQAINKRKVTYNWWVKFNYALSKVLSPSYYEILAPKSSTNEEGLMIINSIIDLFPEKILMPTIKGGLGIISLNRVHPMNIYALGIVKTDKTTHSRTVSPQGFFLHDIGHANQHHNPIQTAEKNFHTLLAKQIQNLPIEKRKNAELIYFLLTHELNTNLMSSSPHINNLDLITKIYYRDFSNFIDLPTDHRQVTTKVKQAINDFTEVFYQIKQP